MAVRKLWEEHAPLLGMGMTSLVLGVIALMLFFLPILGIPLSLFGLFFGTIGLVTALFGWGGSSLRWSVAGIVLCGMALVVNVALWYGPEGYLPQRSVPRLWRPVADRPYVPPPAN